MNEAEAFEDWADNQFYGGLEKVSNNWNGSHYSNFAHHMAWCAWQAALEWQRSQCEPFGYFKCELDGWIDCAETDDGAIALYEAPPTAQINDQMREALESAIDVFEVLAEKLNISDLWSHVSMLKEALAAATPK